MEYHERPGVYVEYDMSGSNTSTGGTRVAALAALGTGTEIMEIISQETAVQALGENTVASNMARLMLLCGAGSVLYCPVTAEDEAEYEKAASRLLAEKKACVLTMDTENADAFGRICQLLLKNAENGFPCIGVAGMTGAEATELVERAAEMNCQRLVLTAGSGKTAWDDSFDGRYSAAAMAGLIAGETDPALPLNGAELTGLTGLEERWSEEEIDQFVRAGVTPLEAVGTLVSLVRVVTTKTTEGGEPMTLWRELEVVRIVDDVIPGVRDLLKNRFARKKNNVSTRGAIRSAVAMALEDRVKREIIESYSDISASANGDDPTVCDVSFSFTVVHGLGRIFLTAHITV